jgi:hypothetical protein
MSRALLVPGAIIAVLASGIWVHTTRAPATQSNATPVPTRPVARVAPAIEDEPVHARPAVSARAHERSPADRIATPARIVAPPSAEGQVQEPPHAHSHLPADTRIPAEGGEPSGPARTIEEMQALVRQESEGLVTIRNADGSETLNHEDRFRDYSVLKVGADGQPVFVCVQGEAALKQALRRTTPATRQTPPPATARGDR